MMIDPKEIDAYVKQRTVQNLQELIQQIVEKLDLQRSLGKLEERGGIMVVMCDIKELPAYKALFPIKIRYTEISGRTMDSPKLERYYDEIFKILKMECERIGIELSGGGWVKQSA